MNEIKIVSRWDSSKVLLCGKYESIKDCLEKNWGANLRGAYLGDAKNYSASHDFAFEIIRRQEIKTFTDKEWSVIGQITIHHFCWENIKKRYGKIALSICKKLTKAGFDEFEASMRAK